jgi:hypothetical protein
MTTDVDAYFANATRWRDESERLRAILLDCGLDEVLARGALPAQPQWPGPTRPLL